MIEIHRWLNRPELPPRQTPECTDVSEERINTWAAAKFADISKVCFIVPVISKIPESSKKAEVPSNFRNDAHHGYRDLHPRIPFCGFHFTLVLLWFHADMPRLTILLLQWPQQPSARIHKLSRLEICYFAPDAFRSTQRPWRSWKVALRLRLPKSWRISEQSLRLEAQNWARSRKPQCAIDSMTLKVAHCFNLFWHRSSWSLWTTLWPWMPFIPNSLEIMLQRGQQLKSLGCQKTSL